MASTRQNVSAPATEGRTHPLLRIFIAYRRDDSQGFARSIHDRLALQFGQDAVFRDINDIEPGRPWEEAIEHAGWETDEGVRVGMSAEELREIYPDAQEQSFPGLRNVLVLIEGSSVIGEGGSRPVLSARLKDETVDELQMSIGAAGD